MIFTVPSCLIVFFFVILLYTGEFFLKKILQSRKETKVEST